MSRGREEIESDPFSCNLCGGYIGSVRRVEGRDSCRSCAEAHIPDSEPSSEYRPTSPPEEFVDQYVAQAVESRVFDREEPYRGSA